MATGAQHDLPGHQDEVLALAAAGGMLFSGGKDKSIRAWQFDASAGVFAPSPVGGFCPIPLSTSREAGVQWTCLCPASTVLQNCAQQQCAG